MKRSLLVLGAAVLSATSFALGQETQRPLVAAYESLADVILGAKRTEANLVRAILASHHDAADAAFRAGDFEKSAAEMALFANEGDNAVGGVRKRLLEGGHHHNAEGEAKGIYEPGFVIVTRDAKQKALAASAALRAATTADARQKGCTDCAGRSAPLCG